MKTKWVFVIVVLGLKGFSQESAKQIKNINQVWGGYYNSIIINQKWLVNSDIQFRTKDWLDHPSQALIRTGLVRRINEKLSVTVGLAHFRFYLSDVATRGEWRPWQEIALTENYKKLKVFHRFRSEERFNQKTNNNEPINDYTYNWRFRYKLDLQFPLASRNNKALYFTIGNEIFINAGNIIKYNYFDQDRLSAGFNIELNKNFTLQPQFIYIWQQENNGITLDKISVFRLNILHKIKF
ncbi:MAG TPA: DUF2490 domain-containing protein, partial [Bacteroidia bacterium]|nr:DUF2490 domain-containing protein [Bacteroidia bacterium]